MTMEIGGIYGLVLAVVMIAMISGVGIILLDRFSASTGLTAAAETALNNSRDAIAPITSTWLSLIVTIAILAVVLSLVLNAFRTR